MFDSLPKSKSPTKNAYRMVPLELAKLQEHTNELLSAGFIKPVKALYKAQVLLREEENGKLRLSVESRVLKQALMKGPTLRFTDVTQPIEVQTDASDYAFDDVLVQNGHPIAEKSYTVFEKETLVMVHYLRAWRLYSQGSTYAGKTNNSVIGHFSTQPKLASNQVRWHKVLLELDFQFEHKKRASNWVANALSKKNDHVILCMLARIQTGQIGGPMRNVLRESLQKDFAAQNGVTAKVGKTEQENWVQLWNLA